VGGGKMGTKLTLRLDDEIIRSAKNYAKEHKTSISRMVAAYLSSLTLRKESKASISPIVKEISGIIPEETDIQSLVDEYRFHLEKKYK
jgi:hypothetical protein